MTEADAPRAMFVASWDAPANANPVGYDVYLNGELVAENTAETEYSFEGDPDAFYSVGVVALYPDGLTSVKVVAVVTENLQDMGLIAEVQSVALDMENPDTELTATNANHNTQADITIIGIDELSEDGQTYLEINSEALPYVLGYGESFNISIAPAAKSVAQTKVIVTYVGGEIVYNVSIDGELLSVTEMNSEVTLYPNPANTSVRVEAESGIESVKVYNMMGDLVATVPANRQRQSRQREPEQLQQRRLFLQHPPEQRRGQQPARGGEPLNTNRIIRKRMAESNPAILFLLIASSYGAIFNFLTPWHYGSSDKSSSSCEIIFSINQLLSMNFCSACQPFPFST